TRPLPRSPLAPPNPAAQRLGRTADLLCDRLDRRPFRFILVRVLADQPNRPLPHLRRVLLCSCHGSNFSRVGASGKLGAIQVQTIAAYSIGIASMFEPTVSGISIASIASISGPT